MSVQLCISKAYHHSIIWNKPLPLCFDFQAIAKVVPKLVAGKENRAKVFIYIAPDFTPMLMKMTGPKSAKRLCRCLGSDMGAMERGNQKGSGLYQYFS
jgi:hypothetical protein